MATLAQISSLRRMTALEENDAVYTDALLGGMVDDLGFEAAAAQIWKEKAAAVAGLVDTTESGSSRRLSQLREGYLEMARGVGDAGGSETLAGSFTVGIERV